jgi:predicted dehydrogenase
MAPCRPAIRLGLVGVGRWGRNYVRTIATIAGAELTLAVSGNPATAALVPKGCRVVRDWREAIDAADIDGVIIAAPPATHCDILLAAIAAGKPALVEKPVVASRRESAALRAYLAERPATVLVDHIHLFHPAFVALQREATSLGPIRAIRSAAGNRGPYRKDVSVLWDWAPHDLALALTLVPGAARAIRAERADARDVDGVAAETLSLQIDLAGGIPVSIRLSTLEDRHRWFAVMFDSCTLVYRDAGPATLSRLPPGEDLARPGQPISVGNEAPLTRAVLQFIAMIRSKDQDPSSIALGLDVVDLTAALEDLLAPAATGSAP